jgi:phage shock protein C
MNKRLYRNEYHKQIGGVCSGLAEYFDIDVTLIRIIFVITAFTSVGFITYLILWAVLPKKGYLYNNFNPYNNPTVDYTVPPQQPGEQFNASSQQAGSPYGSNPFGSNPYTSNPFENNPFNGGPANMPPKSRSNAGVIFGAVLIFIGAAILIDEYDLIPDFDFDRYWPLILVIIGGALIASGQNKKVFHKDGWSEASKNEETNAPAAEDPSAAE